jgi:succinate dehydrogenase/fumarate reductase flavoprotein subunit
MDFVEESAATLTWLMEEAGVSFVALGTDVGAGSVHRMHQVEITEAYPSTVLLEALGDRVWTETRADALVVGEGRVLGVRFLDLVTGESGWVAATNTVVATGGFARNLDRLLQDRPEIGDQRLLIESHHGTQGLGHAMLEAVDPLWQNQGHYGVYAHSIPDVRDPDGVESLFFPGLFNSLIVNLHGERVANEQTTQGFQMSRIVLDAPEGRLFALLDQFTVDLGSFSVPAYNWQEEGVVEEIPSSVVLEEGGISRFESLEALATALGIDEETLVDTAARYAALVESQEDVDFGKDPAFLKRFVDEVYYVMELTLGAAKAYGGVDLSDDWQVLDASGVPIPGLFAAGEVAGMLGTPGVGDGFSGSISACYYGGRQAAIGALED